MRITGSDVKLDVLAVKVCPNTALPVMDTVPLKTARSVVNEADELAGEALCVAVSALRWVNVYDVFGVNPVNSGDGCHDTPPSLLYWQPVTVVSVMLEAVLLNIAGAAGAVWVAFSTGGVPGEVTLPLQFTAVITMLI